MPRRKRSVGEAEQEAASAESRPDIGVEMKVIHQPTDFNAGDGRMGDGTGRDKSKNAGPWPNYTAMHFLSKQGSFLSSRKTASTVQPDM